MLCSCCVVHEDGVMKNSDCWHIEAFRGNNGLMEKATAILELGFEPDHVLYYGDFNDMDECEAGQYEYIDEVDVRRGVLAIQLYVAQSRRVRNRLSR